MTTASYTAGTGVPGPGYQSGGIVGLDKTLTGENVPTYSLFGCKIPNVDPIQTPDWEGAKVYFERKVFTDGMKTFGDGVVVPYWGFEDTIKAKGAKPLPSPLIRMREGDLVHVKMETRHGVHTIHHHGIEPSTMNDGVGHVSFETSGNYVYQFKPTRPGTYFYNCHANTVLHFEMGLYGLLIVDPLDGGYGAPYGGADRHRYEIEKSWVLDDMDPRWHHLSKDAGQCGDDAGLNIFKPKYFRVNGTARSAASRTIEGATKISASKGQRILIRLLNASYSVLGIKIKGLESELISVDGHALIGADHPWSSAKIIKPGEEIFLPSAARHALWIDTNQVKSTDRFMVEFRYYDWITKKVHNTTGTLSGAFYEGAIDTCIDVKV